MVAARFDQREAHLPAKLSGPRPAQLKEEIAAYKRRRILEETSHLFFIQGYDATTLDAVAERPAGLALVRVKTEAAYAEQGALRAVRLHVIDNGPGFTDKVLKRAFEPYVTSKSRGTGLGLAVVKKIADDHGARIDISNRMHDGVPYGAQVSLAFKTARPAASPSSLPAAAQPLSVV